MVFDYEDSTKNAYKNPTVVQKYHTDFSGRVGWRTFRFHYIARKERELVNGLLSLIRAESILDIPCGTGKLAVLLAKRSGRIVAADISEDMLKVAKQSYMAAGCDDRVSFAVGDVEHLCDHFGNLELDAVVCLRLMHRVPTETRKRMLDQIARTAKYAVISFGIDSPYHKLRKKLRRLMFGGAVPDLCLEGIENIRREIATAFHIERECRISPLMSEEVLFLLRSKAKARA